MIAITSPRPRIGRGAYGLADCLCLRQPYRRASRRGTVARRYFGGGGYPISYCNRRFRGRCPMGRPLPKSFGPT